MQYSLVSPSTVTEPFPKRSSFVLLILHLFVQFIRPVVNIHVWPCTADGKEYADFGDLSVAPKKKFIHMESKKTPKETKCASRCLGKCSRCKEFFYTVRRSASGLCGKCRKKPRRVARCAWCKIGFTAHRSTGRYCSATCRSRAFRVPSSTRRKRLGWRKCEMCGSTPSATCNAVVVANVSLKHFDGEKPSGHCIRRK